MAITVGSVANFSSGQAFYHCSAMLDTNKVVLVYRDQNDSSKTKIVVGTVSGTSVSWGTDYRIIGTTLPTVTVASKTIYVGGLWNDTDSKVDILSVNIEE